MIKFTIVKLILLILNFFIVSNTEIFLHNTINNMTFKKEEIFDVRCFWINGLNVYDISPLEKTDKTYSTLNLGI